MPILLATIEIVLDLVIQAFTVALVFRLMRGQRLKGRLGRSFFGDTMNLAGAMVVLFLGHLVQIALWSVPFRLFGEFSDSQTAFYHSAVNYTTLGYGDIVMSAEWRILGALEAASGVLMFGVSTATFLSIMRELHGKRMQEFSAGPDH
jgi:voltage-gated potassium channel Kch